MNLFIINTNKSTNNRYEQEMIAEQKCSAYRSTKTDISDIKKGDKVLLYSNEVGIIARGTADGQLKRNEDNGEPDAEYYMELDEFYEYIRAIPYRRIVSILKKAHPGYSKPFNVTSLKFSMPASKEIWGEINKYV